jgi:hypothetical protein
VELFRGQSPGEADLNLLETARRCELYGMKMHAAKDHEGVPLNLAVAHMGLAVFQGITRINTFSWAKIRKISFKRKKLLIKLHPEGYVRTQLRSSFFSKEETSARTSGRNVSKITVSSDVRRFKVCQDVKRASYREEARSGKSCKCSFNLYGF